MNDRLNLEIGGSSCYLGDDTSISIEMNSPLFNDSGSFSYPIQIAYSSNEFLFRLLAEVDNDEKIERFKCDFTLYIDGYALLYGIAIIADVDKEDNTIDIELTSGNKDFEDIIDGMSLHDLDFGERISLGTYKKKFHNATYNSPLSSSGHNKFWLTKIYNIVNTEKIYPLYNYCQIPVLFTGEKKSEDWNKTISTQAAYLSAKRRMSSPCFFLLFVLKEIFHLMNGFSYLEEIDNELYKIEDVRRMVFINTKFKYKLKQRRTEGNYYDDEIGYLFEIIPAFGLNVIEGTAYGDVYATSENLPDISIKDFLDSFFSAFGAKLHVDYRDRRIHVYLLRNIFKHQTISTYDLKVSSIQKETESFKGFTLKYSEEDGDEYKYYGGLMSTYDNYTKVLEYFYSNFVFNLSLFADHTMFVKKTGNHYRVKVEKSTGGNPALFEVSQFLPYQVKNDEDLTDGKEIEIGFSPVIPTTTKNSWHVARGSDYIDFTYFADVTVACDSANFYVLDNMGTGYWGDYDIANVSRYEDIWNSSYPHKNKPQPVNYKGIMGNLLSYDAGFTVGIIRTLKNDGETTSTLIENADGFGNSSWIPVTQTFAITNDFVSENGDVYLPLGQDSIKDEDLVSLRISSVKMKNPVPEDETPKFHVDDILTPSITGPFPKRGLAPQFYSDYIYFLTRRKTLTIKCRASVSFLSNIRWEYPYLIEGYRCFINKISFSVSSRYGIGEVTMEVFTI